ncbi:hypothetical protein [Roseateles oligotrophus]|uniref:Tail tube GTA-gp10-like protein n=1 Tax=Roseateles oligotrophus TaxID=1769250 RepID=A0ABT2YM94_9BURK|nr:hypothetical protein [Roseateles oligotrophus]MCV2371041.1 hypothetical protein [Roseateles oligotrophus]
MSLEPDYRSGRWAMHFEEIDKEIVTLALMCELPLATPGALERVLHGDIGVCGKEKPAAFGKLRGLLMLHYSDQAKAIEALGPEQALALVGQVVDRLRERFGDRLGAPEA